VSLWKREDKRILFWGGWDFNCRSKRAKYFPGDEAYVSELPDFSRNLMPFMADLEPDEAGPDPSEISARYGVPLEKIIVLSRNENPYGPSPKVWESFLGAPLHRYPDSRRFLKSVSDYSGFPEENIIIGAGLDEIITTVARLFLGTGDKALIPVPTYNLYGLATRLCGAVPIYRPMLPGFEIDTDVPRDAKMIFLCSPNNPTGSSISEQTVRALAESTNGIVFLDEAYAEFAKKSLINLVHSYDNLMVGRTLSKAFGLAGLRLGYALAPTWMAKEYRRAAPLFSISSLSLAAGEAALKDLEFMRSSVGKISAERERMRRSLKGAYPSQGNFLYIHCQEQSCLAAERLLRQGIAVRDCGAFPGAGKNCLRVTVGKPADNDRFIESFMQL
jgi:histidinol-phosphate aminotransferase